MYTVTNKSIDTVHVAADGFSVKLYPDESVTLEAAQAKVLKEAMGENPALLFVSDGTDKEEVATTALDRQAAVDAIANIGNITIASESRRPEFMGDYDRTSPDKLRQLSDEAQLELAERDLAVVKRRADVKQRLEGVKKELAEAENKEDQKVASGEKKPEITNSASPTTPIAKATSPDKK